MNGDGEPDDQKVTSGSRWRGLETDLYEQRSASARHRQRWIGPKDLCSDSGTAPARDPTFRISLAAHQAANNFQGSSGVKMEIPVAWSVRIGEWSLEAGFDGVPLWAA